MNQKLYAAIGKTRNSDGTYSYRLFFAPENAEIIYSGKNPFSNISALPEAIREILNSVETFEDIFAILDEEGYSVMEDNGGGIFYVASAPVSTFAYDSDISLCRDLEQFETDFWYKAVVCGSEVYELHVVRILQN